MCSYQHNHLNVLTLSAFVLILFWFILSLQGGGCGQPPFVTTGLWREKVLGFRENYLWGRELCRVLHSHRFIGMLHSLYITIQCCCKKMIHSVCDVWHSGSGVLWGALQSGLERYSISHESSGHQYPFDQLSDHRKVSPPPWSGRQHEWRYFSMTKAKYFAEWLIDILSVTFVFPLSLVASPDTSVSVFSWQVKSYGQGQPSTFIGVFDINRWYHAQMPDSLRCVCLE